MYTKILIIISMLCCGIIYSQSIPNTLGISGVFSIKDNTNTFFSLNQSNGTINLIGPLAGNLRGSISKGTNRFLNTYAPSGTVGNNTFLGINAGNYTMSGNGVQSSYNTGVGSFSLLNLKNSNNNSAFGAWSLLNDTTGNDNSAFGVESLFRNRTGSFNSAFGYRSIYSNTTGNNNSAFGEQSLYLNTIANNNSAFGYQSLYSNNAAENSAFGYMSLNLNTNGINNSAFGYQSIYSNTTGNINSAFGYQSLYSNTTGNFNSAFGKHSLRSNTTGRENSAFGDESLFFNQTGSNNSAFGFYSQNRDAFGIFNSTLGCFSLGNNNQGIGNTVVGYDSHNRPGFISSGKYNTTIGDSSGMYIQTGLNNVAIGHNAQVNTASNQIRIGNTSITYAGIQVAWTVTSDKRYKENIVPILMGLEFISKLNPVLYTRKNEESQNTEFGFIAQEVEEVLKREGVENSGMLTIDDEGLYALRYNDLIAPMIKALQELMTKSAKKDIEIAALNEENEKRLKKINELESLAGEVVELKEKKILLEKVLIEMRNKQEFDNEIIQQESKPVK